MILRNSMLLGLGSFLVLAISACGDAGVKVAEQRTSIGTDNGSVVSDGSTPNAPSTPAVPDTPATPSTPAGPDTPATPSTLAVPDTPATPSTPAADVPDVTTTEVVNDALAEQVPSDDNTGLPTIASLVGFFVTKSDGDFRNYAGITTNGLLTDYSYDENATCYSRSTTQITDRGMGVFWVQDGDVTTELRLAKQNGNLILFRNEINEEGRVVYPGTTTTSLSDLTLCV